MKKAKQRQFGYVEPDDYLPPEVRKMLDEREAAAEKGNPYNDQSKRLIEKQMAEKKKKK